MTVVSKAVLVLILVAGLMIATIAVAMSDDPNQVARIEGITEVIPYDANR